MRKIFMIWVISVGALAWNITNAFSWDFPLTLYPEAIQFYHSYSNHSLNIRVNADTIITVPEYDNSGSLNQKFAYKIGSYPNVLVKFFTTSPDTPSLTIRAYGSDSWNLADHVVLFDEYGVSDYVTMSSSTSVPNSVGKHNKTWDWYVCKVGGNPIGPFWTGNSSHTYYTVFDTPVSPLSVPWTDVLDYSCTFASGASSIDSVASKITFGIYSSLGDLNGDIDYTITTQYGSYTQIHLATFLDDLTDSNSVWVNCVDVANLFCVFGASLGCSFSMKAMSVNELEQDDYLNTKSIDPIGNYSGWQTIPWKMHQFGWINNVYDPCINVNTEENPIQPVNMDFNNTYLIYLLDPPTQYYYISYTPFTTTSIE
jgi:hypothetical protein